METPTSSKPRVTAITWGVPRLRGGLEKHGIACSDRAAQVAVIGIERDADLEPVRRAAAEHPTLPVLAVVSRDRSVDHALRVLHAIELGVVAVMPADAPTAELAAALVELVARRPIIHPFVGELLVRALHARAEHRTRFAITARERDVLGVMIEGHTTEVMAHRLGITFHTTQSHLRNIFRKLDVGSKAAATAIALRHHLV